MATKVKVRVVKTSNQGSRGPDDYYSKLLIWNARRTSLFLGCVTLFLVFGSMVYAHISLEGEHWILLVPPIAFFGLLLLVLPPTEEWDYQPWQSSAEKSEHYFYD
jgi:hypothetical protein